MSNILPTGEKVLTINEVCKQFGVSRRTVHAWIEHQKVTYVKTPGGGVRIFEDSLWKYTKGYDSQESV